jgi:hypothetical protein
MNWRLHPDWGESNMWKKSWEEHRVTCNRLLHLEEGRDIKSFCCGREMCNRGEKRKECNHSGLSVSWLLANKLAF